MLKSVFTFTVTVALCFFLVACKDKVKPDNNHSHKMSKPLRVAVAPNYEPIIWKKGDQLKGLEVDFASALGQALKRDVELVELAWEDIFTSLDSGKVDIIMSGVSITPQRLQDYAFVRPYTTIGQMAVIRKRDAGLLGQPGVIHTGEHRIGCVAGTTGESYVKTHLARQYTLFQTNRQGVEALLAGQIDFFVHDSPTVWRLANADPADSRSSELLGLYHPLTKEKLAWVISKNNTQLKAQVEGVYETWMQDGTFTRLLRKWLPTQIIID